MLAIVHKLESKKVKGYCCGRTSYSQRISTRKHNDSVQVKGDYGTFGTIREKKSKGLCEVKGYIL